MVVVGDVVCFLPDKGIEIGQGLWLASTEEERTNDLVLFRDAFADCCVKTKCIWERYIF